MSTRRVHFPDCRVGPERESPGRRDRGLPVRADLLLPDAPRLQHAPLRDRDRALHEAPGEQGRLAGALHDPAGLVHHEAEQHDGDDALQPPQGTTLK